MPVVKIFVAPNTQSDKVVGTSDVINMLPRIGADGRLAWGQRPGLTKVSQSWSGWPTGHVRAWKIVDSILYAIVGNKFVSLTSGGSVTAIGTLNSYNGRCWIDYNGFLLAISDGIYGYTWDKISDFSLIEDFTGGKGMAFLDGFMLSGGNGAGAEAMRCYASDVYDAASWPGLSFGSVESNPDPLLLVEALKDSAIMYGDKTIEVWSYNGDGSAFPFAYMPGTAVMYGLAAKESVASFMGSKAALLKSGNQLLVGIMDGYNVVSIMQNQPSVAYEWQNYSRVDDAIAYAGSIAGYSIYVITFPTVEKTWAYEGTTGIWLRLETNGGAFIGENAIEWDGKIYISDSTGNVYLMDESSSKDGSLPIYWKLDSDRIPGYSQYKVLAKVTLDINVGTTAFLPYTEGYDPQVNISISDDGGHIFKPSHTISIGKQGEYRTRVTARRLGRVKDPVIRVSAVTDSVRYVVMSESEVVIE